MTPLPSPSNHLMATSPHLPVKHSISSEKDLETLLPDDLAVLIDSPESPLRPVGARATRGPYFSQVDRSYRRRRIMASDKENNTHASSGPGLSPRTKLANSTNALSLRDSDDTLVETNDPEPATHGGCGLDGLVTGGCSTCGSAQHDTVKCNSKVPPSEPTMSGALQTDLEGSAWGTNIAAKWRAQASLIALLRAHDSLPRPVRRTGRRNSV